MKEPTKLIEAAAETAHRLITDLYHSDPDNVSFTQVGLLDGRDTIMDFISHDEWGCALDHLLYMIHESDIDFPRETVHELHDLAKSHGMPNHYSKENRVNLTQAQLNSIFNAP
jgi:hypothetical protein